MRLHQAAEAIKLRDRIIEGIKKRLEKELEEIKERAKPKMTPFVALFERDGDRFKCIGVFNPETDENIPEEFLFCVPIEDPETMREFEGF